MPISRQTYKIDQSPFYRLGNRKRLSHILGISSAELRQLSKHADTLYREFDAPKKTGGTRRVENPVRALKLVQARLARFLGRITPPNYLFCPVKGRCYVTNAARHRGQRVVRCLDVRRYFSSTSSRRVFWFFHSVMKCERDIAAILTRLATYNGHLPTGSPLSPIMAYFAHIDVWEDINAICLQHECQLTVYIDDVTVSGASVSAQVMWQIRRAIHRAGLRYHKEKIYIDSPAEITGVIVRGEKLLPPNRQLLKARIVRTALRGSLGEGAEKQLQGRLDGLEGQMAQIRTA